jgi:rubrerythrin
MDILKQAILLEKRGKAFYGRLAQETSSEPVKRFFGLMAEEEDRHIAILAQQFKNVSRESQFVSVSDDDPVDHSVIQNVMTNATIKRIAAADFESAAIAAAMAMEKDAVKLYSERARSAEDEAERALYRWLANWEKTHLKTLSDIDQAIKEEIWHDNNYWPF